MFYLSALFAVLSMLFSALSVLLARRSLQLDCQVTPEETPRGETAHLRVRVRRHAPLPVSPLRVTVGLGDLQAEYTLPLNRRTPALEVDIPARHIGALPAGVLSAAFTDALGLFRGQVSCRSTVQELLVLPRSFEVAPLRFLDGEDGRALQNRTTEDLSSPEDTRVYRQGDPLKRVHWKLSARRRELIVRKFETPAPPDTLILLDCTPPASAALWDALCETALSVAEMQAKSDAPVRVPLYGGQAVEFLSDRSGSVAPLAEMLARQPLEGGTEFFRVLNTELRRMRRTGATVIITAQLNAGVVEGVKHIRRMGPSARVYYITLTPDDPSDRPYIAQLQQSLVEVCYVKPA